MTTHADDAAPGRDEGTHRHHEECYACPVGGFFLTARGASPEAMDHLVNAATELVAAAKAVLEAAEGYLAQQRSPEGAADPEAPSKVQRINLDG